MSWFGYLVAGAVVSVAGAVGAGAVAGGVAVVFAVRAAIFANSLVTQRVPYPVGLPSRRPHGQRAARAARVSSTVLPAAWSRFSSAPRPTRSPFFIGGVFVLAGAGAATTGAGAGVGVGAGAGVCVSVFGVSAGAVAGAVAAAVAVLFLRFGLLMFLMECD